MKISYLRGDYKDRQVEANRLGVDLYIEHHFNSGARTANYAVAIVATNHSRASYDLARFYARTVAEEFNIHVARDTDKDPSNDGVFVGGWDGRRGNHNLKYTNMPAVLLEPLFASNPTHAEWIRSGDGRERLAQCLVRAVRHFANGRTDLHFGFSVGHKYKVSRPTDRGVAVYGGGNEADYAEDVLWRAERMLAGDEPVVPTTMTTYIVETADNVFHIARKFNISPSKLIEVNGLDDPNLLQVGQKLKIPVGRKL